MDIICGKCLKINYLVQRIDQVLLAGEQSYVNCRNKHEYICLIHMQFIIQHQIYMNMQIHLSNLGAILPREHIPS